MDKVCFLKQAFGDTLNIAFPLSEMAMDPLKDFYITDKGELLSYIGCDRKQVIPYIQKINFTYINKSGYANSNKFQFPGKLYASFIRLKEKKDLIHFLKEPIDFCVFPTKSEMDLLLEEYKNVGVSEAPVYLADYGVNMPEEVRKEYIAIMEKVAWVNINFIWKKQQELKSFVEKYAAGELKTDDCLPFYRQLENVSPTFTDEEGMPWKVLNKKPSIDYDEKLKKYVQTPPPKPTLDEIMETKKLKETRSIEAYRIYGHYALCCLELFLDMQYDFPFFACEKCGQVNYRGSESKRKTCLRSENERCFLDRQNKRQESSREWKKTEKPKT
jgi:hypothetical protein